MEKLELTKENWASLTDEEKTHELQKIMPGVTYQEYREEYERLKELGKEDFMVFNNPVITLELIDPVMAASLMSWMYRSGDKIKHIPIFGYEMKELTFDKSTLMEFSDDEKTILQQAFNVLKNRIYTKQESNGMF